MPRQHSLKFCSCCFLFLFGRGEGRGILPGSQARPGIPHRFMNLNPMKSCVRVSPSRLHKTVPSSQCLTAHAKYNMYFKYQTNNQSKKNYCPFPASRRGLLVRGCSCRLLDRIGNFAGMVNGVCLPPPHLVLLSDPQTSWFTRLLLAPNAVLLFIRGPLHR